MPRSEQLDLHMPADGFFLFFVDFDNTMINFEDFAGTGEDWFDREQRAARLIYVPGGVPVAERPVPVVDGKPVFSAFPVVELRAVVTIDFPNGQDGHAETLGRLADKVWQGGWYGDRDIRLGGYALTPQSDPTDAIADHEHRVAGGDLEELRRQAEREWVPLAQLGSEDPVESATLARFMVKRASAVVGDFSQVLSVAEFME